MVETAPHRFAVRVYYEDTDAAGIVYYANYLKFAERARTEWMRDLGLSHSALAQSAGAAWAVRSCAIDYRRPARLDDALTVETRLTALGGASADLVQIVRRDDEDLARLTLRLAFIAPDGRPRRLPPSVRALFAPLTQSKAQSKAQSKEGP